MSEQQNYVVKISTALSNKPMFVRISDTTMSIDHVFTEAISTLKNTGKPLEAQQLEQLFKEHQIFNNGKVVQKGNLFSELEKKAQTVGNSTVQVAELDLISSHHGGVDYQKIYFHKLFSEFRETREEIANNRQNLSETAVMRDIIHLQNEFLQELETTIMNPEALEPIQTIGRVN
jgi:hypothetical protein